MLGEQLNESKDKSRQPSHQRRKLCWHKDKCKNPKCKFWHPKGPKPTGASSAHPRNSRNNGQRRPPRAKGIGSGARSGAHFISGSQGPLAIRQADTLDSPPLQSDEDEDSTDTDEEEDFVPQFEHFSTNSETFEEAAQEQCTLKICPGGDACIDLLCPFCDPFRPPDCKNGAQCLNVDCTDLHPPGRKVCDKGVTCCDFSCTALHPSGRTAKCSQDNACSNPNCEYLHPDNWIPKETKSVVKFKSKEEREQDQTNAALPMLKSKEEFIRRLQEEKVLIVTAETGSGKTTQLSQYAADAFDNLIVCTQPRAIAAVSIARRIASEYDGTSVGNSVGYQVSGNKVNGSRIMIVTDAALIRMAQKDRMLKKIGVLIIDEAHERSLNTDIVVGIAKKVLQNRPEDFRIVISSATIDPKPFMKFFSPNNQDRLCQSPLDVPGRVYPVTMEIRPISDDVEDINTVLSEEVAQTLREHKEGHCLVFLHGSREVDRAVSNFKKIANSNWIVYPLYGGLPPEEQNRVLSFNDQNGSLRMIVFCTNVAETSLTVPNVRIVIDTGLAKEARFDPERRMTLLEEVYISRSSADQRKGRAGRTASGHCVRLFSEDKITRQNIAPEILRSSLDLVMLQLCSLEYNPLDFEFIDRPDVERMKKSIEVLSSLGCLTDDMKLTPRGHTFIKLPFDPRMSHFVLTAHEKYGHGFIAAEIAAILTAPGSVIYFGGQKKTPVSISNDALLFHSDLLHHRMLYNNWLNAGKVTTSRCQHCSKYISGSLLSKDGGCRSCRVKYSNDQHLNNKILDIVRNTTSQVRQLISDKICPSCPGIEDKEAIGRSLAESFPEQIGEFLIPANPNVGVHLISSKMRGQLSFSSTMLVSPLNSEFLIAMTVTKLPTGRLILNNCHSVNVDWLPVHVQAELENKSLDMVECFKKTNVNNRYSTICFKHFRQHAEDENDVMKFVECLYDSSSTTMTVYSPRAISNDVSDTCSSMVNNQMKEDLDYEKVVESSDGGLELHVSAGLNIKKMNIIDNSCSVRIDNPPVNSNAELMKWICEKLSAEKKDIKRHVFYPSTSNKSASALIIFKTEKLAQKCRNLGTQFTSVLSNATEVRIWSNSSDPIEDIICGPPPLRADKKCPLSIQYEIYVNRVPQTLVNQELMRVMKKASKFKDVQEENGGAHSYTLTYNDETIRDEALEKIETILRNDVSVEGDDYFYERYRRDAPRISTKQKKFSAQFVLKFLTSKNADTCYNNNMHRELIYKVDGNGHLDIEHPECYSLDQHLEAVAKVHGIKYKSFEDEKNRAKSIGVYIFGGLPSKCAQAVQDLKALTAPVKYFFGDEDKRTMAMELKKSRSIPKWAEKCSVFVKETIENQKLTGITIYGEKFAQGQFMAKLADYYNSFQCRYQLITLPPSACCLFHKGGFGDAQLKQSLVQNNINNVTTTFVKSKNAIEVLVDSKVSSVNDQKRVMKQCQDAIDAILKSINQQRSKKSACVYCRNNSGRTFIICGHNYCSSCIENITQMMISKIPSTYLSREEAETLYKEIEKNLKCPVCRTTISIKDIASSVSKSTLEEACTAVTVLCVRKDRNHSLTLCPAQNCRGLIERKEGYATCCCCKNSVCPSCGVTNDERHLNRTCSQYKKLLLTSCILLEDLFRKAEKYAREQWPYVERKLGKILGIHRNPGLANGCMALKRYSEGIKALDLLDMENHTIFGWHGTSSVGLAGICDEGFDPSRRSGQVHGRGEYFGISASTSAGYNQGTSTLIVAQIIKSPAHFKTEKNFCYVVDNPTDWKHSFCLPVVVVCYGVNNFAPIWWNTKPKQPLPHPFYEELPYDDDSNDSDDDSDVTVNAISKSTITSSRAATYQDLNASYLRSAPTSQNLSTNASYPRTMPTTQNLPTNASYLRSAPTSQNLSTNASYPRTMPTTQNLPTNASYLRSAPTSQNLSTNASYPRAVPTFQRSSATSTQDSHSVSSRPVYPNIQHQTKFSSTSSASSSSSSFTSNRYPTNNQRSSKSSSTGSNKPCNIL